MAKRKTGARRIGVVNAVTAQLDLAVSSGGSATSAIELDLGDSAPSTVYATTDHEIVIVEGENDLPAQVAPPPPGKQLRHRGTVDATSGTIVLGAYRSVELKVPRGSYDVFTDYTP